ncbi:protein draper-like [Ostrea edulis]|uniref:protein draper-like n=1 Tax=Ostrea edulis TaxID=37623 RepID=UPI0024AF4D22|nr:protein draper-like [Ostrea edulis]
MIKNIVNCKLYGRRGFFRDCCPDSKWDERKASCVECSLGFTGVNCSLQCKYPYFGKGCHGICNCSNTTCDPGIGCPTKGILDLHWRCDDGKSNVLISRKWFSTNEAD